LRNQCQAADVPFFFKRWGAWRCFENSRDLLQDATEKVWQHLDGEIITPVGNGCKRDAQTATIMVRVGKKRAGRLLDGREWNEYPDAENGYSR